MFGLKIGMGAAQIAAGVRGQERAGVLAFLAVAEERAPHPGDAFVPGQLAEGLGLGHADQLGGLGAIAQIFAVPVGEKIDRGAIDQLEALGRNRFPVVGRNALAANATGDRDKLQVEILNPKLVDFLAHLPDHFVAAIGLNELLDIGVSHNLPPCLTGSLPAFSV